MLRLGLAASVDARTLPHNVRRAAHGLSVDWKDKAGVESSAAAAGDVPTWAKAALAEAGQGLTQRQAQAYVPSVD